MDSFIKISNFSKIAPYAELFWQGLLVTVLLSLFTVVIGFCLALVLALMRMSNVRPFRFLGIDREGHQRERGVLVAISKFNPLEFNKSKDLKIWQLDDPEHTKVNDKNLHNNRRRTQNFHIGRG